MQVLSHETVLKSPIDGSSGARNSASMTKPISLIALGAALLLAACNSEDHTIVQKGPPDPLGEEAANAAPPPPLPSIAASKTYRCSGSNEVVEVDWMELGGKAAAANIRVGKDVIAPMVLSAPAEGTGPYADAAGVSLTGTKEGNSITLARPGKPSATCKA